jgi:hypothetical protein
MKKSELYARYNHWNQELIEIDANEFNNSFGSHWSVGWQGDIDSDQFYCKIKRLTMAEIEELASIFG